MSGRNDKPATFAARPGASADAWVRAPEPPRPNGAATHAEHTARLTIDVTPALRGRIKIMAFRRGLTVADMLRTLLESEFPDDAEGAS